jgi:FAD/FMN-containing dehydrogenase
VHAPTSRPAALSPDDLDDLRDQVRGAVIAPDDPGYDAARQLYYGGVDLRPAAIVRVRDAEDVAAVVTLARTTGMELAVRSGGHGLAGYASSDGGVVIDLAELDGFDLDLDTRTVWAGAGLTAGAYTAAAGELGLATGFGDAGGVGLGGLTVGGGIGFLTRKHGLTIDSLLAAEVVTADGEVRLVDAHHDPELFWGIRGGGGNLGVVTRLRFALHDVSEVTGGLLVLPATPDVLAELVAVADAAPDELTIIVNTMVAPPMPYVPAEVHGQLVTMVVAVHVGRVADGETAFAPLRALGPLVDEVGPMAYADLYEEEPEDFHPSAVVRSLFRDRFEVADAEVALAGIAASTASMAAVQLRVLGGAVARVPDDATAYAHRQRRLMINVAAMFEDPTERAEHEAWAADLAGRLHDERAGRGVYVNFLGDEGADRVRDAYPGGTWGRLVAVKRRYDPDNLFRRNQNVPPG